MRDSEDAALGIGDTNSVTGLGVATIRDVAGKEPGMAASRTIGSLAVYFDEIQ